MPLWCGCKLQDSLQVLNTQQKCDYFVSTSLWHKTHNVASCQLLTIKHRHQHALPESWGEEACLISSQGLLFNFENRTKLLTIIQKWNWYHLVSNWDDKWDCDDYIFYWPNIVIIMIAFLFYKTRINSLLKMALM